MVLSSLLLSLLSCVFVVEEDGVLYDCTCDVLYDDYAYYNLTDFYSLTTCDPRGRVAVVTDRVAFECVEDYSYGGYYYATCDCVCTESFDPC